MPADYYYVRVSLDGVDIPVAALCDDVNGQGSDCRFEVSVNVKQVSIIMLQFYLYVFTKAKAPCVSLRHKRVLRKSMFVAAPVVSRGEHAVRVVPDATLVPARHAPHRARHSVNVTVLCCCSRARKARRSCRT